MTNYNYINAIIATLACVYGAVAAPPADYDLDRVLDAIRIVETGGEKDPANAVGDNGRSIGPFQIQRGYWQDALEHDPSIGGTYADCKDETYARRVIRAYLSRYVKTWNDETVARIHNGGPSGAKKKSTIKYWQKVRKHL
jgi:hypothetical protein